VFKEAVVKAEDIAAYFLRKIAKPINYDIRFSYDRHSARRFYVIEPTAVRDLTLHVIVAFRHELDRDSRKQGTPYHCGEAEIPLVDGDTVESVLDMAIAQAVFAETIHNVSSSGDRIEAAHSQVYQRLGRMPYQPNFPRI
jgi:hypothetical protein